MRIVNSLCLHIWMKALCLGLVLFWGGAVEARQQIPFGFFRAPSSSTLTDSFEGTWSGCAPPNWSASGGCAGIRDADELTTPTSAGSKSLGVVVTELPNTLITRTIDLTGYTTMKVDVLSRAYCDALPACLTIIVDSIYYNFCSTANNQSVAISFSGSKLVQITGAPDTGESPTLDYYNCPVVIDNLRFE